MSFISIDDCGRGENCPIHYRVTAHDTAGVISLIDYVGDYVVHTLEVSLSDALWAFKSGEDFYDFHVKVFYVGEKGTLADLAEDPMELLRKQVRDERYCIPDDVETEEEIQEQIMAAHLATMGLIRANVIAI